MIAAVPATPVKSSGPTVEDLSCEIQALQSQLSFKDAELLSMARSLDALKAVNQASSVHYASELTKLRTVADSSARSSPSATPSLDDDVTFSSDDDAVLGNLGDDARAPTMKLAPVAATVVKEPPSDELASLQQSLQSLNIELQQSRADVDRVRAQCEAQLQDLRLAHAAALEAVAANAVTVSAADDAALRTENQLLRDRCDASTTFYISGLLSLITV